MCRQLTVCTHNHVSLYKVCVNNCEPSSKKCGRRMCDIKITVQAKNNLGSRSATLFLAFWVFSLLKLTNRERCPYFRCRRNVSKRNILVTQPVSNKRKHERFILHSKSANWKALTGGRTDHFSTKNSTHTKYLPLLFTYSFKFRSAF